MCVCVLLHLLNLSVPMFPDFTGSSRRSDIRAFRPMFQCQVTDNSCAAEGDPAKLRTIYAEKLLEQARIDRHQGDGMMDIHIKCI